ncbi:Hypothetical predicted protein [Paramuricea clavata]|uniref:Uncharacterized protein n=1 Tax=Paramuricea clavata TaxID=317549 RepID=A0A7D9H8M2_PARCT|nr:Hypothetical predicted protein [Paramuricea clavata]
MATFLSVTVIFVCLLGSSISYQETNQRISKLNEGASNSANKNCRSDTDCIDDKYCHEFHRLCLRRQELVTVAPVKTSAKRCSEDSGCKIIEYCHSFWKICLPSQTVHNQPPTKQPSTKRPSWYCRTSKDCKRNEQCHKRFRVCYTRPAMSTVRRDTGNSRRCDKTSDCGTNFYCHDHFRICLEHTPAVTQAPKKTTKTCSTNTPCPKGMLCHDFWNICYTPAHVLTLPQKNKTQQCQIDSDCRPDEFCHTMVAGPMVARQRRNIKRMCLPRTFRQFPKSDGSKTCKTDADCGPNKSCLGNLGVCMAYKLPGEMCLIKKTGFASPCASGSYCKSRGKWASPRRIINKMKLPQTAANHLLKGSNKKKRKVGRCTPSSF